MPTIVRQPKAGADLSEIWEFIAEESVDRADAMIDRIDAKFQAIAAQPLMGRERKELAAGLRSMPLAPYVIYYQVLTDGIVIVRVLHGARDAPSQFEDES
jgi:toxin ParE1/3/4